MIDSRYSEAEGLSERHVLACYTINPVEGNFVCALLRCSNVGSLELSQE